MRNTFILVDDDDKGCLAIVKVDSKITLDMMTTFIKGVKAGMVGAGEGWCIETIYDCLEIEFEAQVTTVFNPIYI